MRDLIAGLYFVISAPGSAPSACPCGLVLAFFAKSSEKWFCEIGDDPWWFLDEFWCVFISFPLFFVGFRGFRWFPWCRGAPGANCPAGLRFPCVLRVMSCDVM